MTTLYKNWFHTTPDHKTEVYCQKSMKARVFTRNVSDLLWHANTESVADKQTNLQMDYSDVILRCQPAYTGDLRRNHNILTIFFKNELVKKNGHT